MKILLKICTLCAFLLFGSSIYAKERANIYAYSRDVPQKSIIGETGAKVKLDEFNGDFVMAVFWSRYCVPCIRELKGLSNFVKETKNEGIRVIMISPKNEWISGFSEQRQFLKRFEADNLEIYVDEKEALASALGIFSSPVTILISRDAQEIGRIRGSVVWDNSDFINYIRKIKADKG
ncbi:MAG: TlpA family protein disulfide reductase [Alphaproteobacteria bacterium]|nr:TlpA family protein disulfide reductase [Alphaproteobacteria bacterium]